MSNGNNRNDGMQDYFDLLNEYSQKGTSSESVSLAQKKSDESVKKINTEALGDVVDADFFKDFGENTEKTGDINRFFENSKKPAPPPMVEKPKVKEKAKKPSPLPPVEKNIKEIKEIKKIEAAEIEKFEEKQEKKTFVLPENAPFEAEIIADNGNENEKGSEEFAEARAKKEKNPVKRLAVWFNSLSKKKKIIVSVVAVFLAIILIFVSAAGIFVGQKFSLMGDNIDNPILQDDDIIYDDEEYENIEIDIGSAGFKQSLIDWATTGNDKHMSSKNVINVLLIGADSRSGRNEGNTDVMMLVSVNRKTKTLKMISFLRDSYLYIEGDNNSYCTKLNAAYSMGGPECLIETIENNYKIEIDNYVMVNFESFKEIVDAMGGITVDVQEYEANYTEGRFNLDMPSGDGVTLNGKQALAFCRIRGSDADGDVSRTRRQRQVIDSMVNRVMSSSISEINKYIDVLLPYVDTGYSETQIISLGFRAITNGWAKYERNQLSMPSEDCRTSGDANMWIWVVDYQKAAYQLQMELYGTSNIDLDENRVTIIDVYRGANYSGSSTTIKENDEKDNEVPDTTEKKPTVSKKETTEPQTEVTEPDTTEKETSTPEESTTEPQTETPETPDTTEVITEEPSFEETEEAEEVFVPEDETEEEPIVEDFIYE